MGVIRLHGMQFYAYTGVLESERELGQRFEVDVEMSLDLQTAAESDDLDATVDYSRVFGRVREIVSGPPFLLIEALAGSIADAILAEFPVERVVVRVRKPHVSMGGLLQSVEVELERERSK